MSNEIIPHKDFFNAPNVQKKIAEVVQGSSKQFTASLLSIVNNSNLLSEASNESIMNAAMKAAVLNLPIEPSLGFAYIVPYNRSYKQGNQWFKVNEAQFQIGYKGLIQLAIRSGQFKSINSGKIYKSQFKKYDPMFEKIEVDFSQEQDEVAGYFASFELLNGFRKFTYWTKEETEAHGRRFSKSYDKGPWSTDFDAMSQKTVLKDILSKYAPLSVEMKEALVADNESEDMTRPPIDVTPSESQEEVRARKMKEIEEYNKAKSQIPAENSTSDATNEEVGQADAFDEPELVY
ncbi:recombinase RecT [Streptococcus uberis]|uniref:recombinase RecT n=1 Tax=Streptococcus uberis TaxID=1349 RepID=UPI002FE8DC7F